MNQKKKKRPEPGRFLHVLILIVAVVVIFEGKMLINVFTNHGIKDQITAQLDELFADIQEEPAGQTEKKEVNRTVKETDADKPAKTPSSTASPAESENSVSDNPDSSSYSDTGIDHSLEWVVKKQAVPVDDSYFADATFIGDSRLEGFRNQSGITEGSFLTSVGMNVVDIFTKQSIASPDGNITVFQAMYPEKCKKIYFMLGTNELGNVWEDFTKGYRLMLSETKRLFPEAVIYAIAVPYVEEALVTTSYINNENVDKMNNIILNICKEGNYHFIDINEVLSDGNHSLISGAASDGVHMYAEYCELMLDYLKTHYVAEDTASAATSDLKETESETETATN